MSRLKRVCFNSPLVITAEIIFCVENETAVANGEADPDEVSLKRVVRQIICQ
jgi:hypothetical protein